MLQVFTLIYWNQIIRGWIFPHTTFVRGDSLVMVFALLVFFSKLIFNDAVGQNYDLLLVDILVGHAWRNNSLSFFGGQERAWVLFLRLPKQVWTHCLTELLRRWFCQRISWWFGKIDWGDFDSLRKLPFNLFIPFVETNRRTRQLHNASFRSTASTFSPSFLNHRVFLFACKHSWGGFFGRGLVRIVVKLVNIPHCKSLLMSRGVLLRKWDSIHLTRFQFILNVVLRIKSGRYRLLKSLDHILVI